MHLKINVKIALIALIATNASEAWTEKVGETHRHKDTQTSTA